MWERIPNTMYEVSTDGCVRSLDRVERLSDGRYRKYKGKNLKPRDRHGYWTVQLGRNNEKAIHRLVAEVFLPNPLNCACINHIDGNKKNNNLKNLEWCTYSHNLVHAYDNKLNPRQREVIQIALDGTVVEKWKSASECERVKGFDHRKISRCCNGKAKTHRGYRWSFV